MSLFTANLTIPKRRLLLKSVLVLVFSIILAWLTYQLLYKNKVEELKNIQSQKLFIATNLFSRELSGLGDLLTLLASSQALFPKNDQSRQTQGLTLQSKQKVQNYFIKFGKSSSKISQIRWLDHNGQEVVRVEFVAGEVVVPQVTSLQNKQARYYFKQGMQVAAPNMYVSPIDLNVERGEVIKPFEPVIRGTIKTSSDTHLFSGLLIINYRLDNLLATIRDHNIPEAKISIINREGYWLLHPHPDKEWGFMLDQPRLNLKTESPEFWHYQNEHSTGGDYILDNVLSSFIPLAIFLGAETGANTSELLLYATSNPNFLSGARTQYLFFVLVIFLSLAVCGFFIIWREFCYQCKLIALSLKLQNEQQELERVNDSLTKNIVRQQLLQDELVEANKLSSLGLMVAGVAHELNTPIGGAIICVSSADNANEKLKKSMLEGLSKSQFSAAVELIHSSLHLAIVNLDKAVNHLKHFKRLAIDRVNEDYIECLLDEVVSDLIVSLQPLFIKSKVVLVEDIEANLALLTRPGIISQVLENFIINSLKHGFAPGQPGIIEIKARRLSESQISILVSDNGSGIPSTLQNNLFDPFVTSGRGKGNIGLGLYMVNQWVTKLLEGQIMLNSEQNGDNKFSTQFTVLLPVNSKNPEVNNTN
ncbi:sensor histidine kinase [Shewanella sp. OMA3-2]|uniref:sensor histidine kinase n=1 Tax=Shewanella sp. OMA3-2 TaxID=2908650 RepID=UPI001F2C9ED3|nr:ATP-binding protein [Shewanella sp. OMA3-2]UJF20868.1 ATP-binding protein [Shewanella sp. OMA3-2]